HPQGLPLFVSRRGAATIGAATTSVYFLVVRFAMPLPRAASRAELVVIDLSQLGARLVTTLRIEHRVAVGELVEEAQHQRPDHAVRDVGDEEWKYDERRDGDQSHYPGD